MHTRGLAGEYPRALTYIDGRFTHSTKTDKKLNRVLNTRRGQQKGKKSHVQGLQDGSGKYTCSSHGVA